MTALLSAEFRECYQDEAPTVEMEIEPITGPMLTLRQWEVVSLSMAAFGSANVMQDGEAVHVPITAERIRSWPLFHEIVTAGVRLTDTVFSVGCWIDLNHPSLTGE